MVHTPRTRWALPRDCLPRKPSGREKQATRAASALIHRPRHFDEGAQRFNAGWSSPVARQAHNLKVIGSNPIPATKIDNRNPAVSIDCWVFAFVAKMSPNCGQYEKRIDAPEARFLFVTTSYQDNCDCSMRSGDPGFVRITRPDTLEYREYDGKYSPESKCRAAVRAPRRF